MDRAFNQAAPDNMEFSLNIDLNLQYGTDAGIF
jgi:hypothetical protein